jgi:hypothetical protein
VLENYQAVVHNNQKAGIEPKHNKQNNIIQTTGERRAKQAVL